MTLKPGDAVLVRETAKDAERVTVIHMPPMLRGWIPTDIRPPREDVIPLAAIQQLIAAAGDAHSWLVMPWDHDDDEDQRWHAEIATALGDILAALPQALRETT